MGVGGDDRDVWTDSADRVAREHPWRSEYHWRAVLTELEQRYPVLVGGRGNGRRWRDFDGGYGAAERLVDRATEDRIRGA